MDFLVDVHSILRYVVLILLIIVIFKSLAGWLGKKPFQNVDNKLALFLLISAHIQLLIGLVLYFTSDWVNFGNMKDKVFRYWTVEHITMMIIAIVLITIAKSSLKRLTTDEAKFKRLFIFNTLALIIIIAAIQMSGRGLLNF
jgi:NADH:ubiquinone oxidoreductase subunit 2 (subunit N)